MTKNWKRGQDLNLQWADYGSAALPLSYPAEMPSCRDLIGFKPKSDRRTENPVGLILRKVVWPLVYGLRSNAQRLSQFSW